MTQVFIRFGEWSGRSMNFLTGEYESGISVYPARIDPNGCAELDPTFPVYFTKKQEAFPVTGIIVGIGGDGEPLLKNISVLPFALSLSVRERVRDACMESALYGVELNNDTALLDLVGV